MIPRDPIAVERLKKLADRNIENGDWGDEVMFPGEDVAQTPEEREGTSVVSQILSKAGGLRIPKRK